MKSGRAVGLLAPLAGFALSALVLSPGQYSFDSAFQLWQARTGAFEDTSPVAMAGLWSLLLRVDSNPASLLWVNLALFWAGLGLGVAAAVRSTPLRLVLVAVLGLAPLALVEMGQLLSDAHLAALLVFATGLTAWGLAAGRRVPLVIVCAVLVYAGCIRHNAPIALLPFGGIAALALFPARGARFAGAQGTAARESGPHGGEARGWRAAGGAAALVLASMALGTGLDRVLATDHETVWPSIALWDLAAISVAQKTMLLPAFTRGPGLTAEELVSTGAFDPASNTLLYQKSRSGVRDGLGEPYSASELSALRRAWIEAVLRYPQAYARHRLRTLWLLIGPHRGPVQGVAYFEARSSYRDNPPLPAPFAPIAQRRLYALAAALTPTWCFAALPYLGASLLAIVLAARREPRGRVAVATAASAILYTAPFVLLAPGAELRYLTWPIVAGPLALVFALVSRGRGARRAASASLAGALVVAALHVGTASAASLALVGAAPPEASIVGFAWGWQAPAPLGEGAASRVTWGIEVDGLNVHARHARRLGATDIAALGVTPNLRIEWPREGASPYAEIGVGGHLLSHTALRGGPNFGTAFQFGEWLGAGLRFGAKHAFELGLRIEHLSNADIKLPNDGMTFGAVHFGWHY